MVKDALVKIQPQAVSETRSIWQHYVAAKWWLHVVVPVALGGIAAGMLTWSWTMLSEDEYGAAMALAFLFLFIGLGASLAIRTRRLNVLAIAAVVLITVFSGAKICKKREGKPWTTLFAPTKGVSAPAGSPTSTPTPEPSQQLPSPLTATPTVAPNPKRLYPKPTKKEPCSADDRLLGLC